MRKEHSPVMKAYALRRDIIVFEHTSLMARKI